MVDDATRKAAKDEAEEDRTTTEGADKEADEYIQFSSIRVSSDCIDEVDRHLVAVSISKTEIKRIELRYGIGSERPAIQLLLGLVFFGIGCFFLVDLVLWLFWGGTAYDVEALAIGLIPLGGWLMCNAVRKKYFLFIHLASDRRKLVFKGKFEQSDLLAFIDEAIEKFGFNIEKALIWTSRNL